MLSQIRLKHGLAWDYDETMEMLLNFDLKVYLGKDSTNKIFVKYLWKEH